MAPDTAAGVLIGALLSGFVGPDLILYGFLMYRYRGGARRVYIRQMTRKEGA